MKPATDIDPDTRAAVERLGLGSPEEQAEIMGRGKSIQTLDDLEGLTDAQIARLKSAIEVSQANPHPA